jgi:RNA polymerase sigma-70 factor (ECF subfamily)
MDDEDEDDTVQRMLRGDEDAFRTVYRAIQPGLLRYLTVMVGSTDAEDGAAETWTQAVRDLETFTGAADRFRGWITTIARNRALDLLRKRGRRPIDDTPVEEILIGHADRLDVEGEALSLVSTAEALQLIAGLPRDQAEAVLLRAVVGLDAKTAGRVLGKRAGAVRTAAYRGLKALQEKITAESDKIARPDADEVR